MPRKFSCPSTKTGIGSLAIRDDQGRQVGEVRWITSQHQFEVYQGRSDGRRVKCVIVVNGEKVAQVKYDEAGKATSAMVMPGTNPNRARPSTIESEEWEELLRK